MSVRPAQVCLGGYAGTYLRYSDVHHSFTVFTLSAPTRQCTPVSTRSSVVTADVTSFVVRV